MIRLLTNGYVEFISGDKIGLAPMTEDDAQSLLNRIKEDGGIIRLPTGIYINSKYIKTLYLGD